MEDRWVRTSMFDNAEARVLLAYAGWKPMLGEIRLVVERRICGNECCEKWRGQFACLMRSGVVVSGANCRFCPECGRKLEG